MGVERDGEVENGVGAEPGLPPRSQQHHNPHPAPIEGAR
jgi:hypothetical protein